MFCILAILLEVVIHIIAHTNEGSALRICIVSIDKEYFLAYIIMQIKTGQSYVQLLRQYVFYMKTNANVLQSFSKILSFGHIAPKSCEMRRFTETMHRLIYVQLHQNILNMFLSRYMLYEILRQKEVLWFFRIIFSICRVLENSFRGFRGGAVPQDGSF